MRSKFCIEIKKIKNDRMKVFLVTMFLTFISNLFLRFFKNVTIQSLVVKIMF